MVGRTWREFFMLVPGAMTWVVATACAAAPPTPASPRKPAGSRPASRNPTPPTKPVQESPPKVAVTGEVLARVRGEMLPVVVMGDLRHLDVLLERPTVSRGLVRLQAHTDARGRFTFPNVPAGKYTVRVRIPEMPLERDLAELYRAEVEITPQRPALQIQMPYLVMRAVEPNGAPATWDRLVVNARREGGELKQSWNLIFQKEPGANPLGPVEEKGGITIHVEKENGQVSFGYSWSAKDKNLLMFPVVEEDAQVRYTMTVSIPKQRCGYRRFEVRRGTSPAELEFVMEPLHRVQGKVSLKGLDVPLSRSRVSLTVYDPVEKVPVFARTTTPNDEGNYTFEDVPRGLAWVAVSLQGAAGDQPNATYSAAEWLTLGVKPGREIRSDAVHLELSRESAKATAERFQALQQFKPDPELPRSRPAPAEKNPLAPAA